jgi:hypothetical protein
VTIIENSAAFPIEESRTINAIGDALQEGLQHSIIIAGVVF